MLSVTPILFVSKNSRTFKANCSINCSSFVQLFTADKGLSEIQLFVLKDAIIVSDMKYNSTHDFYSRFVVCNKRIYN